MKKDVLKNLNFVSDICKKYRTNGFIKKKKELYKKIENNFCFKNHLRKNKNWKILKKNYYWKTREIKEKEEFIKAKQRLHNNKKQKCIFKIRIFKF